MLIIVNCKPYRVISCTDKFIIANNDKYTESFNPDDITLVVAQSKDEIIPECLINKDIFAVTEGDSDDGEEYEYTNRKS